MDGGGVSVPQHNSTIEVSDGNRLSVVGPHLQPDGVEDEDRCDYVPEDNHSITIGNCRFNSVMG